MANPVAFQGDKAAIFDAEQSRERRFVPFEIKELTFKCSMGCMGVFVWDYMLQFGIYSELFAAGFVANWMYKTITIMSSTVRKIELHQDGKTVTVTPRIGSPMDVKISQVQKLKHEKDLIQTFEEAYLFPVNIAGKIKDKLSFGLMMVRGVWRGPRLCSCGPGTGFTAMGQTH